MDKVSICGNQFRVDFLNEIWPIETFSVVSLLACLLKGNTRNVSGSNLSKNDGSQTACLRDFENCPPDNIRYSIAGTLSSRLSSPVQAEKVEYYRLVLCWRDLDP